MCGHAFDMHGNDGFGHCGATDRCRSREGCKAFRAATPQPGTKACGHRGPCECAHYIDPTRRALSPPPDVERLTADDVEWVVNDLAELGVKIGNQFFFCYKGHSLVYEEGTHDDGRPMLWRPVFKREFGECVHPINYKDFTKIGTVSLDDSDEWKPLSPSTPGEPT